MRFILTLTFFIVLQSCSSNSDKGHKQSESNQNNLPRQERPLPADTNRIIIFKEHFVVSLGGHSKRADTELQLLDMLKEYKFCDTLYLTVKDASSGQIEKALKRLHELNIKNYKVEVSDEYFKLPY